jgi:hypothetical protein
MPVSAPVAFANEHEYQDPTEVILYTIGNECASYK